LSKHLVFISSIAAQSGCFSDRELTEDRPVVIYGEGEKGNLATIRKIAQLLIH
jgi:hypothetical protein